jgi:hypothetical protein
VSEVDTLLFIIARLSSRARHADRLSMLDPDAYAEEVRTGGVAGISQESWANRARAFEIAIQIVSDSLSKDNLIEAAIKEIRL